MSFRSGKQFQFEEAFTEPFFQHKLIKIFESEMLITIIVRLRHVIILYLHLFLLYLLHYFFIFLNVLFFSFIHSLSSPIFIFIFIFIFFFCFFSSLFPYFPHFHFLFLFLIFFIFFFSFFSFSFSFFFSFFFQLSAITFLNQHFLFSLSLRLYLIFKHRIPLGGLGVYIQVHGQ